MSASRIVLDKLSKDLLLLLVDEENVELYISDSDDSDSDEDNTLLFLLGRMIELQTKLCSLAASAVHQFAKRQCIRNYVNDIVSTYGKEFITHFRVSRALFEKFLIKYETSATFQNLRPDKRIDARTQMLVFLWFAGHEACSFRDLGDRFDLSLSSVSVVIKRLIYFISSLSSEAIKWPSTEKKEITSDYFRNKSGIPYIIGAIDGTHVVIDPPQTSKDDYIDRKGNVSICLQGICNEDRKFVDNFTGYPGSSHDSWVLQNSPDYKNLNRLCDGDSPYPCMANLLTPYKDNVHLTTPQKNYNMKLSSCRVVIEHTFGILKQRFRQLYYCKLRGVAKICHFIRACCVLHNSIMDEHLKEDVIEITEEVQEDAASEVDNDQRRDSTAGRQKRNEICNLLQVAPENMS